MTSHLEKTYKPPNWAGIPPPGLHLDVLKGDKLVQKLMVDEKKCYLFGRNNKMCDFIIDHASCSRLHAALVWHKHLSRMFLIDLGSVHGTFIRSIRLDSDKPQHVPLDSHIHFGASTRNYVLREKPSNYGLDSNILSILSEDSKNNLKSRESVLPEDETELDNLTEFNTAHNRRITTLGLDEAPDLDKNITNLRATSFSSLNPLIDSLHSSKKEKGHSIRFSDREEIINPEDVDPTIGRYRNMVQTVMVPKASADSKNPLALQNSKTLHPKVMVGLLPNEILSKDRLYNYGPKANLYEDLFPENESLKPGSISINPSKSTHKTSNGITMPLLPNPAPPVELLTKPTIKPANDTIKIASKRKAQAIDETANGGEVVEDLTSGHHVEFIKGINEGVPAQDLASSTIHAHKKKKYAKEAWPGKRSANTNLPTSLLV